MSANAEDLHICVQRINRKEKNNMKKIFFLVASVLSAILAFVFGSTTATALRHIAYRTSIGLQPTVNIVSVVMLSALFVVFALLALVCFKAYKRQKGGNE